jgi:hypothetical protein
MYFNKQFAKSFTLDIYITNCGASAECYICYYPPCCRLHQSEQSEQSEFLTDCLNLHKGIRMVYEKKG